MTGPEDAEVAVVKGGQLWLVEPLDDCENCSVHKPDIGVSVPVTEFADTPVIFGPQFLNSVGAGKDVVEKGEENSDVQPGVHEPVHFNQHGRGDDQRLRSVLQKIKAPLVLGIGSVEGRVQRPGVED